MSLGAGPALRVSTSEAQARRAWDAESLSVSDGWRLAIPADVASEFVAFCWRNEEACADLDGFVLDRQELPRLSEWGDRVRVQLEEYEGLCWIEGLSELPLDRPQWRLFYLALGCALGEPMTQYGRLYEVKDRGKSHTESAIPVSMTNAETGFHTDSSAKAVEPDFVGLLCERPSQFGGESLVSNAIAAYGQLASEHRGLLEQPLVRDIVTPGVESNLDNLRANAFPVFAPDASPSGVLFRYMRYWIERGQTNAGAPLREEQMDALDALDQRLSDPRNVASFKLAAGDILWVNNRTLAHNRRAYRDVEGNARLLQRMWIASHSRRS